MGREPGKTRLLSALVLRSTRCAGEFDVRKRWPRREPAILDAMTAAPALLGEELPLIQKLRQAVEGALEGKADAVELALVALLARGHLLIEDVPGVGKTTL